MDIFVFLRSVGYGRHLDLQYILNTFISIFSCVVLLFSLFAPAAPLPIRRAEEAASPRHRPHHLTSKQLVSQDLRSPYLHRQHRSAFYFQKP